MLSFVRPSTMQCSLIVTTFFVLVIHSGIQSTFSVKHEYPKVSNGCICEESEDELPYVECRRTNYEEIKRYLNSSNQIKFQKFEIITSKLNEVNSTMFSTASMNILEFRSTEVEIFYLYEALTSLENLGTLIIDHVTVDKWVFTSARNQIQEFILLDCPGSNDFEAIGYLPKNIASITVQWCRLRSEGRTFKKFTNLEILDLRNNRLNRISSDFLPFPGEQLKSLILSHNPINSITVGSFSSMKKLETLHVEYTNLATLSEATFKPVLKHLKSLQIANNPLKCDCFSAWIISVVLKWNMQLPICHYPINLRGEGLDTVNPPEMCYHSEVPRDIVEYCKDEWENLEADQQEQKLLNESRLI